MALQFLSDTDFKGTLSDTVLTKLRGTADANLEKAEELGISELSCLYSKYDIDTELAKTSTGRNKELVRIVVAFTAYYLYNTVIDDDIPERISENFEKEYKHVLAVCKGLAATFDTLTNTDGDTVTRFRSGSDTLRSHDPFYM
ncbi:hypothetical protein [uncultured Draconibacterium sp.]|uniref:hypothetical protein n=1 Tax=uncultured Draconibacterium sp. TaxID=1573823 RepID=UPI003216EEC7